MNGMIKGVLVFAVGAIVGSFTTYKIMMHEMEENNFEDEDKWLDEDDMDQLRVVRPVMTVEEIDTIKQNFIKKDEIDKKFVAYNNILSKPDLESIEVENNKPKIISIHQFNEEKPLYKKSSLWFYEKDDTISDDNEDIVSDPFSLIGDDALTSFGQDSEDEDVVYVRNDKISVDFEIVRVDKSYQEEVLGIKIEEPHRKKVHNGDSEED